jgi:bifunctional ADP-heptose synthase (sugar kinase/adenylyltransferase)
LHWKYVDEVPTSLCQPLGPHVPHFAARKCKAKGEFTTKGAGPGKVAETAVKLAASGSLTEASEMASKALAIRVASLLGSSKANIELQNPMDSYRLDSLSAIQVRK